MLGKTHSKETKRKLSERLKGSVPQHICGENSFYYGKRGSELPSWKGGVTPDRQFIIHTPEWKLLSKKLYKKYDYKCQRCGKRAATEYLGEKKISNLCLHHIRSFAKYPELRLEESNLVLVCRSCHYWIHSNKNIKLDWIQE